MGDEAGAAEPDLRDLLRARPDAQQRRRGEQVQRAVRALTQRLEERLALEAGAPEVDGAPPLALAQVQRPGQAQAEIVQAGAARM